METDYDQDTNKHTRNIPLDYNFLTMSGQSYRYIGSAVVADGNEEECE